MVHSPPEGFVELRAPTASRPQRARPQHRPVSPCQEQAWLNKRLQGLTLEDFSTKTCQAMFYSVEGLCPPPGFSLTWKTTGIAMASALTQRNNYTEIVVLMLVNLSEPSQIEAMQEALARLQSVSMTSYPTFVLVPHSSDSSPRKQTAEENQVLQDLIKHEGIEDTIVGEPMGLKLAYAVQARLAFQSRWQGTLSNAMHKLEEADRAQQLKILIDDSIWGYARMRLGTKIPDIDRAISPGEPNQIKNCERGAMLGEGSWGKVFKITVDKHDEDECKEQVIKSVSKAEANSFCGLKALKLEIAALSHLSSKEFAHPHVTKLYEVYHSESHVFLRMECGGTEDLAQRLQSRDAEGSKHRPLSVQKVMSVTQQCIDTLAYLHSTAKVAHRDIKPANLLFSETADDATIKFADFGLAIIVKGSSTCRQSCGTLAYMAPETMLESKYDSFPADVWSLGISLVEVFCYSHFVRRRIFHDHATSKEKLHMIECVRRYFDKPGSVMNMLQENFRWEYECLLSTSCDLLERMLDVNPDQRWSATKLADLTLESECVDKCYTMPSDGIFEFVRTVQNQ